MKPTQGSAGAQTWASVIVIPFGDRTRLNKRPVSERPNSTGLTSYSRAALRVQAVHVELNCNLAQEDPTVPRPAILSTISFFRRSETTGPTHCSSFLKEPDFGERMSVIP